MRRMNEAKARDYAKKKLLAEFGTIASAADKLGVIPTNLSDMLNGKNERKLHKNVLDHLSMEEEKTIKRNYYIN